MRRLGVFKNDCRVKIARELHPDKIPGKRAGNEADEHPSTRTSTKLASVCSSGWPASLSCPHTHAPSSADFCPSYWSNVIDEANVRDGSFKEHPPAVCRGAHGSVFRRDSAVDGLGKGRGPRLQILVQLQQVRVDVAITQCHGHECVAEGVCRPAAVEHSVAFQGGDNTLARLNPPEPQTRPLCEAT